MTGPLVYISGPITPRNGRTLDENVLQGWRAHETLTAKGVPSFCPHLSADKPGAFDVDYEAWMALDFYILGLCRIVLMLPGWESSPGACREKEWAERERRKITYSMDECLAEVDAARRRF